jgi:hypothetical protein
VLVTLTGGQNRAGVRDVGMHSGHHSSARGAPHGTCALMKWFLAPLEPPIPGGLWNPSAVLLASGGRPGFTNVP